MHQAKRILQRIIVAYLDVKCPMSRKSEVMKSVESRIAGTILVSAFWFAFIVPLPGVLCGQLQPLAEDGGLPRVRSDCGRYHCRLMG